MNNDELRRLYTRLFIVAREADDLFPQEEPVRVKSMDIIIKNTEIYCGKKTWIRKASIEFQMKHFRKDWMN